MDSFNLQRFVEAQTPVYDQVLAELRAGEKASHWMWFIFPQIHGLGRSSISQMYAISSLAEAAAYLDHSVLGPRLRECTQIVNSIEGKSAQGIFDSPDDAKFRSCMTLFAKATPDNAPFQSALRKFFDGEPDWRTIETLATST